MRIISIALLAISAFSTAEAARIRAPNVPSEPAQPVFATLPALPDACANQETLSGDGLRFITLFGAIDWEGRATQVQVQEPSDSCLKKTATETVRQWKFEPVDPNTKEFWRLRFETTLVFPAEGEARLEMSANDTVKRFPPRYPERCMATARPAEIVSATFDVTVEGSAENIESPFSTSSCLTKTAIQSVEKWRYTPRLINGHAYPRKQVHTEISFQLVDDRADETQSAISKALTSVAITLDRKLDPRIALEKIAVLERQFENQLRDSEKATLLRYRGAAKIDALDYHGALKDLRTALALEKNGPTAEGVEKVIGQLEAALASTNSLESE